MTLATHRPLNCFLLLCAVAPCAFGTTPLSRLDAINVVWDSPSENSLGSMPIGNGDIGANVWVEPNGDLVLLLAKTDAYDDFARLLKIGRVRIKTDPALVQPGATFRQTLNLREGCIDIISGDKTLRVWIDANHPLVQADLESPTPFTAEAVVEIWRTEARLLDGKAGGQTESHSSYGNFPEKCRVNPDVVLPCDETSIAWCHHNIESIWEQNMRHTGLEAEIPKHRDPLLRRTFGAVIRGDGMKPRSDRKLASTQPATSANLQITLLTQFANSPAEWRHAVNQLAAQTPADRADRLAAHRAWWKSYWERSWISISEGKPLKEETREQRPALSDAQWVTRAYALQRFINAAAGRGALPIKFNGTLFTVDEVFDPDYRRWGGPYWLQNTRLPYWSMVYSGDYELMHPLFKMLLDQLPLRKAATKRYFGHDGAYYSETAHFWGNYADGNYGFNRGDLPHGTTQNTYIRRHWVGIIEIVGMMLDYYEATGDAAFRDDALIPMAVETFRFYDQHWKRGEDGKIRYSPSQSLETYWDTVNPTPDVASIRYLLPRLLTLPVADAIRAEWTKQLADQPEIPLRTEEGKTLILPAQEFGKTGNVENPELYAIFPFRLFTVAGDSEKALQVGIDTYHARRNKANIGWQQGPIWAACLGLADEAKAQIVQRAKHTARGYRFPGFYGPNYDWTPDQDQISVFQIALQRMLMQTEGEKILLLPAWPKAWNADFKLHAPGKTVIEGSVRDGKLENLKVTPASRRKDIILKPLTP